MKSAFYLLIAYLFIVSEQLPQRKRQPRFPAYYYWQTPFYYQSLAFPNFHYGQPSNYGSISEDDVIRNERLPMRTNEAQNVESRVKGGGIQEEKLSDKAFGKPESRLFNMFGFVGNPYGGSPFLKTYYQFASATATICQVTSCIPANQFVDIAAQASICGRKRREYDSPILAVDEAIDSSPVVKLNPTALPEEESFDGNPRYLTTSMTESDIVSSKEEPFSEIVRTKRNFGFYTSTITTYSFTTTTITSRVILGATLAATCRPAGLSVCPA